MYSFCNSVFHLIYSFSSIIHFCHNCKTSHIEEGSQIVSCHGGLFHLVSQNFCLIDGIFHLFVWIGDDI